MTTGIGRPERQEGAGAGVPGSQKRHWRCWHGWGSFCFIFALADKIKSYQLLILCFPSAIQKIEQEKTNRDHTIRSLNDEIANQDEVIMFQISNTQ